MEERVAKVHEERPKSFTNFVELVQKYQEASEDPLWYRGCGLNTHTLLPTLYRHKTIRSIGDLATLERNLMVRFRQRSIPLVTRALGDDWETIFFMQHYRIPTRLLDWTESPFIALYFAVMSAPYKITKENTLKFPKSAAVWILNPVLWNRYALSHQSYDGGVLAPGDDALKGYRPAQSFSGMYNYPVALYGAHNSPRIVAQRGVFTIFGQITSPMDRVYDSKSFPANCLVKLVLDGRYLPAMREAILIHGVTESVVFPDLEGLAREIRRIFNFEV